MTVIPKKKRAYLDEQGDLSPLSLLSGDARTSMTASSGTINPTGDIVISGSQFKSDSIIFLTYKKDLPESAATNILHGTTHEGTLSVEGDADAGFYYIVINKTL